MNLPPHDDERLTAALMLVGHTGAKQLEFGYLHDDVPIEDADWWAKALYQGQRITVEHHSDPVAAVEALAARLLMSAKCTWCDGLITLAEDGVFVWPGAQMLDGSTLPTDEDELRAMGSCRWRREGPRWEPGCVHGDSTGPRAPTARADRRRLFREYEASRPGAGR